MDQRAGRAYRITRRKDIDRLFAAGRSARDGLLTILALPNGLPQARCAMGVSKRHGTAVRRNRIRRLCREAFRLSRAEVPGGWDYALVPQAGADAALEDLRASVVALAARVTAGGQREAARP